MLAAGAVLARDALAWRADGRLLPESLGFLWLDLTGRSFGLPKVGEIWAAPVLAALGLALLWACRPTRARRFR